jgi:hypothetical protein
MAKLVYGIKPDNILVAQYFDDCQFAKQHGHGIIGIVVSESNSFQSLGEYPYITHEMWEFKDGLEEHIPWINTRFGQQNLKPQFYLIA